MNFFKKMESETEISIRNIEFLSDINPPYAVFQVTEVNSIYADGKVVYSEKQIVLTLFHDKSESKSEQLFDEFLFRQRVAYEKGNMWDEDNELVATEYAFLLQKLEV